MARSPGDRGEKEGEEHGTNYPEGKAVHWGLLVFFYTQP
jgi:hypothetical protein